MESSLTKKKFSIQSNTQQKKIEEWINFEFEYLNSRYNDAYNVKSIPH
jgi:hypothetical protein